MARRKALNPSGAAWGEVGARWLVAIAAAALLYRAACFAVVGSHPLLRHPVVDAGYHRAWARRITNGDWLGHGPDDVFKPPLYPYFLAGLHLLFGRHIALVQWVQFGLGAGSCVLVALLAGRLLGSVTGRVAGILSAFYAPYVFFELQLLTPALSIPLDLAALVLLVGRAGPPTRRRLAGAGALLGLSAGVRPDVLLPAALVVACLLWRRRASLRGLAVNALCVGAPVLAIVALVAARNWHLTGQFVPISSNAGVNLYVGNGAGADGITAVPVGLRWERLVARVPQEVLERPADASRWWMRAAWREMRAAPGAALLRLGAKAVAFWNRREFRNNICFHFMEREAWPLWLSPGQFAVVVPLAVIGLVSLRRSADRKRRLAASVIALWVGGFWVLGVAFFVTARFRLPAVPLLIVAASWGLVEIAAALRLRVRRALVGYAAVALAVGIVAWPPWFGAPRSGWARDEVNLGNSLRESGGARGALAAYRRALEIAPDDPDAHYLAGLVVLGERPHEALEEFEAARRVIPDSPDVLLALARAHAALGSAPRARRDIGELLRVAATSNLCPKRATLATAHILLADLDPARAARHWEKAWSLDPRTAAEAAFLKGRGLPRALEAFEADAREQPWDWYAHANCGSVLLSLGRAEEAAAAYRRAARLAPERSVLRYYLARALAEAGHDDEAAELLERLGRELPACSLRRDVDAFLAHLRATRR